VFVGGVFSFLRSAHSARRRRRLGLSSTTLPRLPLFAHPQQPPPHKTIALHKQVRAKSKFWYFLRKLRKVKKANGQVVACHEIFEKRPTTVKNFGIWVRYASRTGEHNAYKEYRDTTLNGAVAQLYEEMGSRHRVRSACLQIIKTATVPASAAKRESTKQFHSKAIRFPLTTRRARPESRVYRTVFKAVRPNVAMN
jgi:large subunit ribosomal protein L18Ae